LFTYGPVAKSLEEGHGTMTTTTKNIQSPHDSSFEIEDSDFEGLNDSRLVELARDGEHEAFGELVRRYEARLMRVIGRFIVDQNIVEDLAQEVFLRVFRRMELFDSSRRFGPWLFQIAVNHTLDYLRKTQRRIRWTLFSQRTNDDERSIDPAVSDPRHQLDLAQEVRSVLDQIPEKYRMVLVLRDLENFSTSEIATILKRKEATIRWRLAEARGKFQKLWVAQQNKGEVPFPSGNNPTEVEGDELQDCPPADRSLGR
jgi:RNA polymerase sigma-70 factor, ECF subfamily